MSLLFGNLTESFVTFGLILHNANAGNAEAKLLLPAAAAHFRHTAANDSSYLVYIGGPISQLLFKASYSGP